MRKLILTALFVMVSLVEYGKTNITEPLKHVVKQNKRKHLSSIEDRDIAIRIAFTESSTEYLDAEKVIKVIFNRKVLWNYKSIAQVCTSKAQFSGLYNRNFYNVPKPIYETLGQVYDKISNGLDTLSDKIVYFNNPKICGQQSYVGKLIYISSNNHHYYEKK